MLMVIEVSLIYPIFFSTPVQCFIFLWGLACLLVFLNIGNNALYRGTLPATFQ